MKKNPIADIEIKSGTKNYQYKNCETELLEEREGEMDIKIQDPQKSIEIYITLKK